VQKRALDPSDPFAGAGSENRRPQGLTAAGYFYRKANYFFGQLAFAIASSGG
jgi:hypothetical protein